jgi:hypothetical protein
MEGAYAAQFAIIPSLARVSARATGRSMKVDTVLTVCLDGGWVNAPHRVLRNGTFAAGCPPDRKRPGEGDVIATMPDRGKVLRDAFFQPTAAVTGNKLFDLAPYAGEGVGAVRDLPPRAISSPGSGRNA